MSACAPASGVRRYIGPKRVVLLAILAGPIVWLRVSGIDVVPYVKSSMAIAAMHPFGAVCAFVAIYTAALVLLMPTLPLNLLAGVLWGPILGGGIAALSTTCGAALAFITARNLFGGVFSRRFDSALIRKVQCEFESRGWMYVAFMRLNPAFPTAALNYGLGLTSIRFATYLISTAVFILPPSLVVAWMGSATGSAVLTRSNAALWNGVLETSLGVTALAFLAFLSRVSQREA